MVDRPLDDSYMMTGIPKKVEKSRLNRFFLIHWSLEEKEDVSYFEHSIMILGPIHIEVYAIRYSLYAIWFAVRHRQHSSDVSWK